MKKKILKWSKYFAIVILSLLIISEVILRWGIGLGERPLYAADSKCEYFFKPNQDIMRYGNHFITDHCGCRNKNVDTSKTIIAKFGDSVLSGGSKVEQDSTATTRINSILPKSVFTTNCSAGSWGVENAYNFMQGHIDYKIDAVILVFSSHDWHDNMHFRKVVGEQPSWPNEQALSAITEVIYGYIYPELKNVFGDGRYDYMKGFNDTAVSPGWEKFYHFCEENSLPLLVYLHPTKKELKNKTWEPFGQELIHWLRKKNIPYTTGMDKDNRLTNFRDGIHLNEKGHRFMAKKIYNLIKVKLESLVSSASERKKL